MGLVKTREERMSELSDSCAWDGHRLVIAGLGDEGRPTLKIECSDPDLCTAKWAEFDPADGEPADEALVAQWPCWLAYWISEDDAWQEGIVANGDGRFGEIAGPGPYRVGWRWDGDGVELIVEALLP